MKALCVDEKRQLQFRDIPEPPAPAPGYVTVKVDAAAMNHGDKTFLRMPEAAGGARGERIEGVWGASAAGVVTQIGANVPQALQGRKVAMYRNLQPDHTLLGMWCEVAQVPYQCCLPLPGHVKTVDYSGSLVNVVTAYAFLEQAIAEGHKAVVATAGSSATGRALIALARRREIPVISIVRERGSKMELKRTGAENILVRDDINFMRDLEKTSHDLKATAVFDGVGGALIGQILGMMPLRTTYYMYGFLSGPEQVQFHASMFMMKNPTMKRFSNYDSPIVREPAKLAAMLTDLESCIGDPLFKTNVGQEYGLSNVAGAMAYESTEGRKPVFLPVK